MIARAIMVSMLVSLVGSAPGAPGQAAGERSQLGRTNSAAADAVTRSVQSTDKVRQLLNLCVPKRAKKSPTIRFMCTSK